MTEKRDATSIMHELAQADLVNLVYDVEAAGGVERVLGTQTVTSAWSGGRTYAYDLEVASWTAPDHDVLAGHFADEEALAPRVLALIAGHGWSLSVSSRSADGPIPKDLVAQLLSLLPEGVVVFARPIPDAHWYDERFTTTAQLVAAVAELVNPVLEVRPHDDSPETVDVAMFEMGATVTFTLVRGFARTAYGEARARFPRLPGDILLAGDGWAASVSGPGEGASRQAAGWTSAIASVVATACDARLMERVGVEDSAVREWSSGAERFGPQTREVTMLLVELSRHEGAWAYEQWSPELEIAARGVEYWAIREGREDALADVDRERAAVVQKDFIKHTGRRALSGLVMRDVIKRPEYDVLTREWRGRKGRIHPDDPDVVWERPGAPAVSPPVPKQTDAVGERVIANPFLGKVWLPLVALLAEATTATEADGDAFWRLQVVRLVGDAPGPFVQAARNFDGTLHVEVGGHLLADGPDSRRRVELPAFGYSDPDGGEDALPHRTFGEDVPPREIAATVLEALAVVYDVDAGDAFTFAGTARRLAEQPRFGLSTVGDEVYTLRAES